MTIPLYLAILLIACAVPGAIVLLGVVSCFVADLISLRRNA